MQFALSAPSGWTACSCLVHALWLAGLAGLISLFAGTIRKLRSAFANLIHKEPSLATRIMGARTACSWAVAVDYATQSYSGYESRNTCHDSTFLGPCIV
ncbi:hypothetical protein PAXRUDRAFT_834890 [Paxillus rubicundulus Ve08.2h10]|uniref:Uncharacterized protein n=1 Tax=Paxillus rubicundulus Ve08.2h10 TaxID=930991 RepID=A0A0D0C3H8_9AGAM|nr:hypothetical protein PAXRUDRAFT_834890 [Paxillus rubicundulus Ve08.2h10]